MSNISPAARLSKDRPPAPLQPGTDLVRVALIWAMQARQLYIQDPPSQRQGEVYWHQDLIRLDDESEQDLLKSVTDAFFKWRQKLYRYR